MMAPVGVPDVDDGDDDGGLDEPGDVAAGGSADSVALAVTGAEVQEDPDPTATSFCSVVGLACHRVNSLRSQLA